MGKAKRYLRTIRGIDKDINRRLAEIDHLKRDLTTMGSMDYAKDKVQAPAKNGANYERIIDKLVDLEQEVMKEIDALIDLRREAAALIQMVQDPAERDVLHYYYVEGLTWEQTAEAAHISDRHVYRVHGRALISFDEVLMKMA